jgi:formylglycine-generating enzyme required for sulfatase activity
MNRAVLAGLMGLSLACLLAAGQSKLDQRGSDRLLTNSIGMKLAPIPAGKFLMGSPRDEAERDEIELQHEVEITRPFYLGVYEVTQSEYYRVMGKLASPADDPTAGRAYFEEWHGGDPDHPMENLRWTQAVAFCRKLTQRPAEKRAGRKYRLPSEAEWEYACRAGTSTPFHYGSSLSSRQANFNGNDPFGGAAKGPFLRKTTKVGSYKPNAWGLFDMHGNVAEWCSDFYDPHYYKKSPKRDPTGPAKGALSTDYGDFYRVVRGGSWLDEGRGCRCAYRFRAMPQLPYRLIGFRVVCEVLAKDKQP